ncbi:MAG: sulfatase [Synoicihabitans sp.]
MGLLAAVFASALSAEQQPNFIILLGDDISAVSLGSYGSPNPGTSPHIDRLVQEGVSFRNMFVSQAICAPVRAELYTGLQPVRNGVFQNHQPTFEGTQSVVHYLSELGYRVALTGKRHISPQSVYPFEFLEGFPQNGNARYLSTEDWSEIEAFIKRDTDQPFCLILCSIHAHSPWDAGDSSEWNVDTLELPAHFPDTIETRLHYREYLAEVKLFDGQVGKSLAMMQRLGLEDNTALIVLDENGAGMPGGKWSNYDWGVRSACVMKWPERFQARGQIDALTMYCDILPTLIDAAGGAVPDHLDGRSLLGLVTGKTTTHRDHAFFVHNNATSGLPYPSRAATDGRFKLVWNLTPEALVAQPTINGFDYGFEDKMLDRPERFIYLSWLEKAKTDPVAQRMVERYRQRPEFQLFDLDADPWELTNLAGEAEYVEHQQQLHAAIKAWMEQQGDPGASLDVARKRNR